MQEYTRSLQAQLEAITVDDDDFLEELLEVAKHFRPFSEGVDELIRERGFAGNLSDTDAKVAFIREAFQKANMNPPREVCEWYDGQPVRRNTIFQLCFAFGLDGGETDEFFRRVYGRERSFDCHKVDEAVLYFCLNNGLSWPEAMEIQTEVPLVGNQRATEKVYTGSIISDLNNIETREELIRYLTENIEKFAENNVTAKETIARLWKQTAGPDGLLVRERAENKLVSILDDTATDQGARLRVGKNGLSYWEACLAIFQLDRKTVTKLPTDRSIKPILKVLHEEAQDCFPDRQGIEKILNNKDFSYETVRKWLILLTFYTFWAQKALKGKSYQAGPEDANRCFAGMNKHLIDAGYPELYIGNPYDWIFLYAAKNDEPLPTFRYIMNELLTSVIDEMHQ